jgi:hypothetical protein
MALQTLHAPDGRDSVKQIGEPAAASETACRATLREGESLYIREIAETLRNTSSVLRGRGDRPISDGHRALAPRIVGRERRWWNRAHGPLIH